MNEPKKPKKVQQLSALGLYHMSRAYMNAIARVNDTKEVVSKAQKELNEAKDTLNKLRADLTDQASLHHNKTLTVHVAGNKILRVAQVAEGSASISFERISALIDLDLKPITTEEEPQ